MWGDDGEDAIPIPGRQGVDGVSGITTTIPGAPGMPGDDGEDAILIRGPAGPAGTTLQWIQNEQDLGVSKRSGTWDVVGAGTYSVAGTVNIQIAPNTVTGDIGAKDALAWSPIFLTAYSPDGTTLRVFWSSVNGDVICNNISYRYSPTS
jgi:hypothetical protein